MGGSFQFSPLENTTIKVSGRRYCAYGFLEMPPCVRLITQASVN